MGPGIVSQRRRSTFYQVHTATLVLIDQTWTHNDRLDHGFVTVLVVGLTWIHGGRRGQDSETVPVVGLTQTRGERHGQGFGTDVFLETSTSTST